MCGIFGYVGVERPVGEREVARAAAALAVRGPDGEGVWRDEGVLLGHRRLAVIDLSVRADQPMLSNCGRFCIAFNGEVYNFRELRRELSDGMSWRTDSDTEVILAAYSRWGSECVQRLVGMFAFAIWDRRERSLFLARDRFGVKPLFYAEGPASIMFASRPSALRALCGDAVEAIDPQGLRLYLELGFVPTPHSFWRGIRKLEPGHVLIWSAGSSTRRPYWSNRLFAPAREASIAIAVNPVKQLDQLVETAVARRLVSDVPLGAFLSGGIDSSIVVAMMRRILGAPVRTFSIGFDDPKLDESRYAQRVADQLGTKHVCQVLRADDLIELLPNFIDQYDEPFADSSALPLMALARLARQHVTVALTGDGGDELFGGYHFHRVAQYVGAISIVPAKFRRSLAWLLRVLPQHQAQLLAATLTHRDFAGMYSVIRGIGKDFPSVLEPEISTRTFGLDQVMRRILAELPTGLSWGERASRVDVEIVLPEGYLQKTDVATMAYALEAREPLLDHELAEWAFQLPFSLKLRGGTGKYLLRELAYTLLPRELIDRPKQGFVLPLASWLRNELREWAGDLVNASGAYAGLPLVQAAVRRTFELHDSGRRNVQPLLWAILVLLARNLQMRSKVSP